MRTLAIGDIHGCLTAFDTLLAAVDLQPDDTLVALGDYIDRGPDSRGVIERLIGLADSCNLITLRGNHEQMMMEARDSEQRFDFWMMCGGREAINSYAPELANADARTRMAAIPAGHWAFLDSTCRDWHESERHIFVHAGVYFDVPMSEQPLHMLRWEKLDDYDPFAHESGKLIICGHTPQPDRLPVHHGSVICIDTKAYGNGWLTCLDADSGEYWQANESGDSRRDILHAP